ncbi:MAG: EMC3/TMCO1 family protein [Candidatus Micrarchaeia archaeon]
MILVALWVGIIAVAYTLLSFVLQRKLANMKKVYEMQEIIKAKTKELTELTKKGVPPAELAKKQKEVMSLASESMIHQMKPMIIILPLFFIVFYLLLPSLFPSKPIIDVGTYKLAYTTFFIIIVFVLGMILSISVLIRDKARARKEKMTLQQQSGIQSQSNENK